MPEILCSAFGYPTTNFTCKLDYFWTAARDDHAINGLVWDNTDNKPNMDIGLKWESDLGVRDYSMCGAIHGVRNGELHLHGFPCTEKAYILCQS